VIILILKNKYLSKGKIEKKNVCQKDKYL